MANRQPSDRIGRAGEHYVAAELNRRGAYASPFSGNVPGIDIVATDHARKLMVYIQVKTKRQGPHWPLSLGLGWEIPNKPRPSCLCLGTCAPGAGKSNHDHHPDAFDLLRACEIAGDPNHYWVFVSLENLEYWIVPDDELRRSFIRNGHKSYLEEKGGHRPGRKHDSLHSIIQEDGLKSWKGRWDVLGLNLVNDL